MPKRTDNGCAATIHVGCVYVFEYADYGDGLVDHADHSGRAVTVLALQAWDDESRDTYLIQDADGWQGSAFAEELRDTA